MNTHSDVSSTIWLKPDDQTVIQIIDQRQLPHRMIIEDLTTASDAADAIRDMHVRGAPLIGATAAAGMYLAAIDSDHSREDLAKAGDALLQARPTAVNLEWAVSLALDAIEDLDTAVERRERLQQLFSEIREREINACHQIGVFGFQLIEEIARSKKSDEPVNILTHCNAGWLACVKHGTATAPVYEAHRRGLNVHVWVDETRPRNQGARLTAWELLREGVPHTVVVDNVGGHLMQHQMVDLVIVGTDRTTRTGDVANKIGTYLKALAAEDNGVPFYVAAPSSSIDWCLKDGVKEIPIEKRGGGEVRSIQGLESGDVKSVLLTPEASPAVNFAFDVTPSKFVTGLITERGICPASEEGILKLFPEQQVG